ncbi:hypothetical protein [Streptomyces sp. PSKA30]|uniref:hypothetical protein n=1 Tax=Streptomyces sp. PSKA30 TaxID=2874597 RepID=UPI001CD0C313|nr:hypothetical protein [Streptomyces sp. PSKA30]MBZ9645319.1 hypothetical protein [Streptomyces sp. PSKA30]
MAQNRKTAARRGEKKTPKNERAHRPCPHCGQIQPGKNRTDAPHKPGGLKHRRAKRQQSVEQPATAKQQAIPQAPEPIDAKTIIQGVVERIPAALETTTAGDAVSATGLNVAVRKAVLDEFRTRAQFAGRLAEIDALLWAQTDHGGELVSGTLQDHLRQLRLLRVTEPEEGDRFVVTEGEGDSFEVLRPAYVDELTGKVVLAGHLRRVSARNSAVGGEE